MHFAGITDAETVPLGPEDVIEACERLLGWARPQLRSAIMTQVTLTPDKRSDVVQLDERIHRAAPVPAHSLPA
jgi:hypothetical protein